MAQFLPKIPPKPFVNSTFKYYTGLKSRATNRLPQWGKFIKKTCSKLNQKNHFHLTYKFLILDLLANPLNKYLHNLYGSKNLNHIKNFRNNPRFIADGKKHI